MTDKNSCPVCESSDHFPFLERARVPVFQNWPLADRQAAVGTVRGDLELHACRRCGFVFNRAFDPGLVAYGEDYDNSQQHSEVFSEYMDELVERVVGRCEAPVATIVEVGCGKGAFLKALVARTGAGISATGFDTSYQGPERYFDGRLRFRSCYYDRSAGCHPDLVITRHVIEHVDDPAGFLRSIRDTLDSVPDARLFIETPCVEWILRNRVAWDFFYEHCSLFSVRSLSALVAACGFTVQLVTHLFGGQYLWLEAGVGARDSAPEYDPGDIPQLAADYSAYERSYRDNWIKRLDTLAHRGAVCIWGGGAKGVTFANLVDPACERIGCVVDVNENKQGKYVPGTGHRIVSPAELAGLGVRTAILMNPNYHDEVMRILARSGQDIDLVGA